MSSSSRMSYADAVRQLYELQFFGVKLGLRGIRRLLYRIENPHQRFAHVHIAGSNGKGSTAAMIASVLQKSGVRTGLYTSPHIVDFRERMRVNGRMIPQSFVRRWIQRHLPYIRRNKATFFEAVTAMAFDWFAEEGVDVAVVETGLGGRLDATNVIHPLVSVITSISREHTEVLGNTTRDIAREKAGIIKRRTPCVIAATQPSIIRLCESVCRARNAPVVRTGAVRVRQVSVRPGKSAFSVHRKGMRPLRLTTDLAGEYQTRNIATTLTTLAVLNSLGKIAISDEHIVEGLRDVRKSTGFRGRLSVEQTRPLILADVAHNPEAMKASMRSVKRMGLRSVVCVFGIAADKDLPGVLRTMRGVVRKIVAVRARTSRARDVGTILKECVRLKIPAISAATVAKGLRTALRLADRSPVLVTGSHFVVGEGIALLERRNYLTINQ